MKRALAILLAASAVACSSDPPKAPPEWRLVFSELPAGLLRVRGTSARDVYVVGADVDGAGPIFLHYDGTKWKRIATPGITGDLWWIELVGEDEVRMAGEGGMVVSYEPSTGAITKRDAPSSDVLFGVWGAAPNDVWYVGGNVGLNKGAIWHDDGTVLHAPDPLPASTSSAAFFKAYGFGANAVWMVGQRGKTLFWNGSAFEERNTPNEMAPLMGVHGPRADRMFACGGSSKGVLFAWDGSKWVDETPPDLPRMIGVWSTSDEEAYAVGFNGLAFHRTASGWAEFTRPPTPEDLHAVWVDPEGGIWAVGGQLSASPPTRGTLVYYGPEIAKTIEP